MEFCVGDEYGYAYTVLYLIFDEGGWFLSQTIKFKTTAFDNEILVFFVSDNWLCAALSLSALVNPIKTIHLIYQIK